MAFVVELALLPVRPRKQRHVADVEGAAIGVATLADERDARRRAKIDSGPVVAHGQQISFPRTDPSHL